ncbi:MAG: hypothetical protein EP330_15705 [Deltaproteobacteria bacterium]|nr:MAG: hypothetical protein EP330_15705 [Deltaproteobacteria bacterium]
MSEIVSEVSFREEEAQVALVIDEEVVHDFASEQAAWTVAAWVRYQLEQGRSPDELKRMLRGGSAAEAEGGAPARKPRVPQGRGDATPPPEQWLDIDTLLDGTVDEVEQALAGGNYDHALDSVLRREQADKDRKTARAAIEARRAYVALVSVLDRPIPDLEQALADGAYDEALDALIAAESEGKQRKGALAVLEARAE